MAVRSRCWPIVLALLSLIPIAPGCVLHAISQAPAGTTRRVEPVQAPVDTIRVWAYRWPAPAPGPEGDLARVAARFEASHPGIKVEVTTLGYQACAREVAKAISSGNPPDVFLPPPGGLALYSRSLQIDLKPYLSPQELASYLPQSLEACSAGNRLLALPRWVEGRAWICNASLLATAGLDPGRTTGWTWAQFEDACRRLRAKGYVPAIIDPSSPETLADLGYTLPHATTGPAAGPTSPQSSGQAAGQGGRPAIVSAAPAELAKSLVRQDLAGLSILGHPDKNALDSFRSGRVGFVIGMSPVLSSEALGPVDAGSPGAAPGGAPSGQASSGGFATALVPAPSSGVPQSPLRAGGVIVFRQVEYRGDAHTRLAVEIAKSISTATWDPAFPVLLVPAYRPSLGDWTVAHRWNAVVALASVQKGSGQPLRPDAELNEVKMLLEKARRELKKEFRGS